MFDLLLNPGLWWDYFVNLDQNLFLLVGSYGQLTLAFLFLVVFLESGVVLTPFFPGDSLLFAAGAVAASGAIPITGVVITPLLAAIVGGMLNYQVGIWIGEIAFKRHFFWFKRKYLERANRFYERHGRLAIVVARFVPIIRTYVPFVAGVVRMNYLHFLSFNFLGALLWVGLFTLGGYFFGNLPWIRENFHYTIVAVVLVSFLPLMGEWLRQQGKS